MRILFLVVVFFCGAISAAAEMTLVDGSKVACTNENLYPVIQALNTKAIAQADTYISAGWPQVSYYGYVVNQSGMAVLKIQVAARNFFVGESTTVEAILQDSAGCVILPGQSRVFVKNE